MTRAFHVVPLYTWVSSLTGSVVIEIAMKRQLRDTQTFAGFGKLIEITKIGAESGWRISFGTHSITPVSARS